MARERKPGAKRSWLVASGSMPVSCYALADRFVVYQLSLYSTLNNPRYTPYIDWRFKLIESYELSIENGCWILAYGCMIPRLQINNWKRTEERLFGKVVRKDEHD